MSALLWVRELSTVVTAPPERGEFLVAKAPSGGLELPSALQVNPSHVTFRVWVQEGQKKI